MQITVSIQGQKEVLQIVHGVSARLGNLTPALTSIWQAMNSNTRGRFKDQIDPQGVRWQPLSAATQKARRTGKRKGASNQILLDTGVLRNSIQILNRDKNSITIGTRLPYAAVHNFGGSAGRGHKTRIPQRQFLGISNDDRKEISEILRSYIGTAP